MLYPVLKMDRKYADMGEEELKDALGEYHSIYEEFITEKSANEKAQVEQLTNKNRNLKRLNERLRRQIDETKLGVAKVIMASIC